MIYSKRHATLIEVLIAMTLTVLVLTTLLFFYQQISYINRDTDQVKAALFQLRYVENRLSAVLPRAINEKDKAKDFVFFSFQDNGIGMMGSQNLIFTFDNDVSRDHSFSNHTIARLFLDKDGRLTLAYWPTPKRLDDSSLIPLKKEILLENVENLHFEFFIAPEKLGEASLTKSEDIPTPEPKGGWRKELWHQTFNTLPVMVKVILDLKQDKDQKTKEKRVFIFPLVNTLTPIIYD